MGAIYESLEEKGISHFIEHMLFKGTNKRNNEELNDELEAKVENIMHTQIIIPQYIQ